MLASSRKPCGGARPPRRAKSPALHCGHKQVPARKRQPSARPAGGPMKSSAPTQAAMAGRCAVACRSRSRRPYALHCRAGVHARRGGLRHPGRVLARQGAAPLRRLGRHLPLQGRLYRRQSLQSLPCKGRWMRRKAQTEGCIAGLRPKYPTRPGRALPCLCRGRCLHRPGNLALAGGPRGGEAFRRHTCGIKISVVKAPSSLLRVR